MEKNINEESTTYKTKDIKIRDNITKEETINKKKNSKIRVILVIVFLLLFASISYISLRTSYLEYLEL